MNHDKWIFRFEQWKSWRGDWKKKSPVNLIPETSQSWTDACSRQTSGRFWSKNSLRSDFRASNTQTEIHQLRSGMYGRYMQQVHDSVFVIIQSIKRQHGLVSYFIKFPLASKWIMTSEYSCLLDLNSEKLGEVSENERNKSPVNKGDTWIQSMSQVISPVWTSAVKMFSSN